MTRPRYTRLQIAILVVSGVVCVVALATIVGGGSSGKRPAASAITISRPNQLPVRPSTATGAPQHRARPAATHRTVTAAPSSHATTQPTIPQMLGQELMVRMAGTSPDPVLLDRIRRGEVGGVILYADNIVSPGQLSSLTAELQHAAHEGGNPSLLISTDQEGGQVKRLPWAPPTVPPPEMGADGTQTSETQGAQTGDALKHEGINVDLAPVVDVAHSPSVFIWKQGRSFGMSASTVIDSAVPFANGLEQAGVAPTAKHFPGLGGALVDTDYALQHVTTEQRDLAPYAQLIQDRIPMIMVSTGVIQNVDSTEPAALSHAVIAHLLRQQMGFQGVIITDDLERPTGYDTGQAATRAAAAGADIVLASTTETGGESAYSAMLTGAKDGAISRDHIRQSYQRVLALKRTF
jgi:beta-N-acetylhexosaminidase